MPKIPNTPVERFVSNMTNWELIDEQRARMRMVTDANRDSADQIVQMVKRIAALEEAGDKLLDVIVDLDGDFRSPEEPDVERVTENWRRVRGGGEGCP